MNWGKSLQEPQYGAITVVKRGENAFHVGFFVNIEKRKKKVGEEEIEINGKRVKRPKFANVEYIRL